MMVCARLTAVVAVDQVIAIAFRLGDFQLRADARIVVGRAGNVGRIVGGAGRRHGRLRRVRVRRQRHANISRSHDAHAGRSHGSHTAAGHQRGAVKQLGGRRVRLRVRVVGQRVWLGVGVRSVVGLALRIIVLAVGRIVVLGGKGRRLAVVGAAVAAHETLVASRSIRTWLNESI